MFVNRVLFPVNMRVLGRHRKHHYLLSLLVAVIGLLLGQPSVADWPTFRHDAARSAFTSEALPDTLSLRWSFQAMLPPRPAWSRQERMPFDRAFHPVVGEGLVFFGSSADDRVVALDAETGARRWEYFTEGPVRFAPAYANRHLYVVSDDGYLHCLKAANGSLVWKQRGGSDERRILGNGRMISRIPARGGPVLVGNVVYYAAGIWPSDGIYLYALDADTGRVRWCNDADGYRYMAQPHGGAFAHSGVSAQGYLAADEERLFMPTGRAVPAVFDCEDGSFRYFHLQQLGHAGGSSIMVADGLFLNSGRLFHSETGKALNQIKPGPVAATRDGFVQAGPKGIVVYQWAPGESGTPATVLTNMPATSVATCVAVAANRAVLGEEGRVRVMDLDSGESTWSAEMDGTVYGLAVSDGRLLASTDRGQLVCFDASGDHAVSVKSPHVRVFKANEGFARAAEEILRLTGVTQGYCLDLDCGDGRLAYELAMRSKLQIIGMDSDPAKVSQARETLAAAGLYGSRITILQAAPDDDILPDYFANLVVSAKSVVDGPDIPNPERVTHVQRPYGGVVCLGRQGAMKVNRRGPLEGAGEWTHQYADAANTTCSGDALVKGPLGTLWFDDLGQRMVQRHGRAPAPLFHRGTLFSEGLDSLFAVDAYNGHLRWSYALPGILKAYDGDHLMGTSGSGSNYCAADGRVYVRQGHECLVLDAESGVLLKTFQAPKNIDGTPGTWGHISVAQGLLYGSLSDTNHIVTYRYVKGGDMSGQLTESKALFALHADSGELAWRYDANYSIRHNAIAVTSNLVLLIDRPLALYDRKRKARSVPEERGELKALDAMTGRLVWNRQERVFGTLLAASDAQQSVLMSYQSTRFKLASELGGRMAVFDLKTGMPRWEKNIQYESRPLINGRTIYAQGGAWDLLTGEPRPFNFKRSYACGIMAGAKDLIVYRSATLGYFDLTRNEKNEDFGGIRPGCWINAIPAGGLVLAPDASAGCRCSYLNQSWIALQPGGLRAPVIDPPGTVSRDPIAVTITADPSEQTRVHYTMDGTTPSRQSALYTSPLEVTRSIAIRARGFDARGRSGPVSEARFVVDKDLIPLETERWTVWDAPGSKPPSAWRVSEGAIDQTSNVLVEGAIPLGKDPAVERLGSLYTYNGGTEFRDGTFSFTVNSSDNDGVGAVFRLGDVGHYYLWTMNSQKHYRLLACKQGDTYKVLAINNSGFTPKQTYRVTIRCDGPRMTVFVDGKKDLEAEDATYSRGTVGMYSWGNSGVRFGKLLLKTN